ncbi:MAG: hypothetical protein VX083_06315 [Pseudomonadota bacterium]|jgi:hypothetical protein|nr:hypothetical protein [Pseudomonadota bacterium]MEC8041409.1 hypothetical protein [Pseudomonadota bacterium]MEC8293089.1 hypothetical protein [Pseudomonadota bacterium]
MPQTTNKEAARKDLLRLLEGLEHYRSWAISAIEQERDKVTQEDLNQIVVPSSFFLEAFDDAKGKSANFILDEVRQWYSHTASDFRQLSANPVYAVEIERYLKQFKEDFGYDFFAASNLVEMTASKAMARGAITTEQEYETLVELEKDQSQSIVSSKDLAKLVKLLRDFEESP